MDEGIKQKFFSDLRRLFPHNPEVDGLIQAFENVGLKSNQIDTSDGDVSIDHRNMQHPIRLDAEDCSFFIRTGTCKFGSTCKFNHPVSMKEEVDQGKSKRSVVGSSSKNLSRIPCKFFQTGDCKYGDSCRFNHSILEAEKPTLILNVIGLPKRVGKRNCPFYMRNGMCGYSISCKFHHPDPIFVLEHELYGSDVSDDYMDYYEVASDTYDFGCVPRFLESTQSHVRMLKFGSFPCLLPKYEFSGYQSDGEPSSVPPMVMDHPQDPPERDPSLLIGIDLPLRPGKKVCWDYKYFGLCKLGSACAYDHPEKHPSTHGSTSESPDECTRVMFPRGHAADFIL